MKKIIAIMLMMAMLICGCGRAENTTTEPTNATSGATESTKGTDSVTEAPIEPTEVPTEEVTEPSSEATEPSETPTEPSNEELVDPEPDPYADIKYYPFPLLDMTVAEIEAEYGELEYKSYDMHGYDIEYYLPTLNLYVQFDREDFHVGDMYSEEYDVKKLQDHVIPIGIYVIEGTVYPGLTIGTPANEIDCIELARRGYGVRSRKNMPPAFEIHAEDLENISWCSVGFKIPDEYADRRPDDSPESERGKWKPEMYTAFMNKQLSLPLEYVRFRKIGATTL